MGLHLNMRSDPVSSLTLREPVLAAPTEMVRAAVQRMREKQLGCVFVVDDDRRPLGVFTESTLNKLLVDNPGAINEPLERHMVPDVVAIKLTNAIHCVLGCMQAQDMRFVCVVDDQGRVAALTGQKGLMEYIADHFPGQIMVQRIGGAPFVLEREGA